VQVISSTITTTSSDDNSWLRALHERGRILREREDAWDAERAKQRSLDVSASATAEAAADRAERAAQERRARLDTSAEVIDDDLRVVSVRTCVEVEQARKANATKDGRFVDLT